MTVNASQDKLLNNVNQGQGPGPGLAKIASESVTDIAGSQHAYSQTKSSKGACVKQFRKRFEYQQVRTDRIPLVSHEKHKTLQEYLANRHASSSQQRLRLMHMHDMGAKS